MDLRAFAERKKRAATDVRRYARLACGLQFPSTMMRDTLDFSATQAAVTGAMARR